MAEELGMSRPIASFSGCFGCGCTGGGDKGVPSLSPQVPVLGNAEGWLQGGPSSLAGDAS